MEAIAMRNIGIEFIQRGKAVLKDIGSAPKPGPDEILIETAYSGITNGTERHALMAEHLWEQFPSCHGYQQVGRIVSKGSHVKNFSDGQWVFLGQYVGHRSWNLVNVGQTASHNDNNSHLVIALPDDIEKELCALLGVAGVALRGIRRFGVNSGQKVWVCGQGLIGSFAAQTAKAYGGHVTVSDINQDRLGRAQTWEADVVLDANNKKDLLASLKENGPYDHIIDGSGVAPLMDDIKDSNLLAHHGCIGLLAVRTNAEFWWPLLHATEGSIEVSCHFSLEDLQILIHFVQQGTIQIEPMISHRVPVEQAVEIYEKLRKNPSKLCGIIFDWV